mgnify:CR=1 FL=1
MQEAFKTHKSWDDLRNPESDFVKFLVKECQSAQGEYLHFSTFKLRCLGILWCEGSPIEKVVELFDNLQDGQYTISCNDRDFKPNLFQMFYFATECVFNHCES